MSEPAAAKQFPAKVSLHIGNSVRDAWIGIIRPWFEANALESVRTDAPTAVVTPLRTHAYALKRRLVDSGISLLGLHFVSPAELRELLTPQADRLALREHLRLLLSIAAEECMDLPADPVLREQKLLDPEFLAAKSVARAPDHLLRAIDRFGAAGWDFSVVDLPALQKIVKRFHDRLGDCGFELVHTADRKALDQNPVREPVFSNLLVTGFTGAQWPAWPLLRAAVNSASSASIVLNDPYEQARDIDETWIGAWEEAFGEAKRISSAIDPASDTLFSEDEMRGAAPAFLNSEFLIGRDTTEQAAAVAHRCLQFLAEPSCSYIGIIFPDAGALPRLVASSLAELGIPHHDGIAHLAPGLFESPSWHDWLELQQSPRINVLLQFLHALPNNSDLFHDVSLHTFERMLRLAYEQILIDDLDILERFCAQQPETKKALAAKVFSAIRLLPERACLSEYLNQTRVAFDRLDWQGQWMEISRRVDPWVDRLDVAFPRALYLRWLGEIAVTSVVSRQPTGDHPYARVQLLTLPQAEGQEWSHLIMAGCNEGSWPRRDTGEFARQHEIDSFNRNVRNLNRRATRQGSYGEGHMAIRENHTLYLGGTEQRQIALRQFESVIESATDKITFAASLVQEEAPERLWNPSELLARQYQQTHQRPLTQKTMNRLRVQTRDWLEQASPVSPDQASTPSEKSEPTRIAYDARRNPNIQSNEYDFAFRSEPPFIPTLSVSEIEQLIAAPALVWLKNYLGVRAASDDSNIWNTSTGKWVHDWLAAVGAGTAKSFTRLPDVSEIERRVCAAAEAKRSQVETLCRDANRHVPDWWIGGWRNAMFLSRALAEKLAAVPDWPWIATEWNVEGDFSIAPGESPVLSLRGRIDLLLSRIEPPAGSLDTEELWIVDYKTGAKKPLSAGHRDSEGRRPALKKKLLDGSALQLGLYSMAARTLGTRQTNVSLLSLLVRELKPQISSTEFSTETDIFAELAEMQRTGVFGMHGPLRSAYRFTDDYPLATLAVDPDILEQRWELTHPALVRDEEDLFW